MITLTLVLNMMTMITFCVDDDSGVDDDDRDLCWL